MNLKICLAKSKAGHDKNHVYVIFKEDETNVFLINGRTKTTMCPKKKRKQHVQRIKNFSKEIEKQLENATTIDDELAVRVLQYYQEEESCQKQML